MEPVKPASSVTPPLGPLLLIGIAVSPLLFGWVVLKRRYPLWMKAGVVLAMAMEAAMLSLGANGALPVLLSGNDWLSLLAH